MCVLRMCGRVFRGVTRVCVCLCLGNMCVGGDSCMFVFG